MAIVQCATPAARFLASRGRQSSSSRREAFPARGREAPTGRRDGPSGMSLEDAARLGLPLGSGLGPGLGSGLGYGLGSALGFGDRAIDAYGACLLVRPGSGLGADMRGERLEFLGDAVLYLVAADVLHRSSDASVRTPGGMHAARAPVLRNDHLAAKAGDMGLDALARAARARAGLPPCGRGLGADAVEAIVGAVYATAGYDAAAAWVAGRLLPDGFPGRDEFLTARGA